MASSATMKNDRASVPLDIPALTFVKIFLAGVLFLAVAKLAPLLLVIALSVLLAATLHPVVEWMESKKVPHSAAMGIVIFGIMASVILSLLFLIPEIASQVSQIGSSLPQAHKDLLAKYPGGPVHDVLVRLIKDPEAVVGGDVVKKAFSASFSALNGLMEFGIFLITTIYLLIDGKRTYAWLVAFLSPENQRKMDQTSEEVSRVIFAYVAGQAITCALVAIFTFALLSFFKVPGALTLACIAALFDLLPIVGFIASVVLITLMALTVAAKTALLVFACCVGYHLLENYVIVPKVYGNRMRLSTLVVLLSFLIAGSLAGVPGAILILPLVASYPIVEKIWLKKHLGERVIKEHAEITPVEKEGRGSGKPLTTPGSL